MRALRLLRLAFAGAAAIAPSAGSAAPDAWSFDFGQGIAEYAVGSFAEGGSSLALSCAEAGVRSGVATVSLRRAGFTPRRASPATFITDRGQVTLMLGPDGSAEFARPATAPRFRSLWRLLATARRLSIRFGPGAPMRLPVDGAAALLGPRPCPRQLAR